MIRIYESYNVNYVDYPWPQIYSYDTKNIKQKNIEIMNLNELKIYNPKYRLCMYSQSPCTNFRDIKGQILIQKVGNYYSINPKS